MKVVQHILFSLIILSILSVESCGTSHQVAGKGLIQKRKYTKGWYMSSGYRTGKPQKSEGNQQDDIIASVGEQEEILSDEMVIETEPIKDDIAVPVFSWVETEDDPRSEKVSWSKKMSIETRLKAPIRFARSPFIAQDRFTAKGADPGGDYAAQARSDYKKAWMWTILALICVGGGLILLINAYIGFQQAFGAILLIMAFIFYIMMFVFLTEAAKNIVHHDGSGGASDEVAGLRFLVWAHIIIGSLIATLFFAIPLILSSVQVNRVKKLYKDDEN